MTGVSQTGTQERCPCGHPTSGKGKCPIHGRYKGRSPDCEEEE